MLVATGIDYLDLNLFAVDLKWTPKNVKYVRDVLIREGVCVVVIDQTGLANSRSANDHNLDGFNDIFVDYLERLRNDRFGRRRNRCRAKAVAHRFSF